MGIVLGSKSDLFTGKKAAEILSELEIPYEITVASAHRTPSDVVTYCHGAPKRGIKVLIGDAGLSAALPGVMAAHTLLPVLGVPVSSYSGGEDALYAITQCPPGVPVGSVGIDGAKNAALLAARILALPTRQFSLASKRLTGMPAAKIQWTGKISTGPCRSGRSFLKAKK